MKSFGKAIAAAALGLLTILMCGCASSNLVDKWHDPSFKGPPLCKMLVIAVRKDATKRRIWEDAFAGELAKHSVAAIVSYRLFPDAPPDTNQIVATAQANGFDGILVILRLSSEIDRHYVQRYTFIEQDERSGPDYNPYWQRYWTYYREPEYQEYIDSQTVDRRVVDVTTTGNGGRLIWSATSRTPDPGSVTDVQREIVSLVISELVKRRIISLKK